MYVWLKCSNAFWEHCSLYLSCLTFEHSLSVLADNWHDLQHGSMLRHSEQQRSYLGFSRVPSHPVGLFQSPPSLTFRLGKRVEELPWGSVVLVVLFGEQQLILSFLLLALFDDDLHCMDCYCKRINLYIYFVFIYYWIIITRGNFSVHLAFFQTWSPLIVFSSDFHSELDIFLLM